MKVQQAFFWPCVHLTVSDISDGGVKAGVGGGVAGGGGGGHDGWKSSMSGKQLVYP